MKQNNEFDLKHQELINFFIKLCLSDKNFLNIWRFKKSTFSFDGDISHLPGGQKLTKTGQDLIKELKNKFDSCIQVLIRNKTIPKPKNDTKGMFFRLVLTDLLNTYADLINKYELPFSPNEKLVSALGFFNFLAYKKYVFSKTQVFKIKIFLANFHPTFKENSIRLLPNLTLEKADFNYFHLSREAIDVYGMRSEAVLVYELKTEKFGNIGNWGNSGGIVINNFQYPRKEVEAITEKYLTAFRLLKEGMVGVFMIQSESPDPFSRLVNFPVSAEYQIITPGLRYELTDSDLPKLKKISNELELLYKNSVTRICLSRFNKSYIRSDPADQLIDLVIAMEAITTPEADSLTYKVSSQIARLLINDRNLKERVEKRKSLKAVISKIYKIRSSLVHRGSLDNNDKKLFKSSEEAVQKAREIVRQINITLIRLLLKNKLEDIIDNVIFS